MLLENIIRYLGQTAADQGYNKIVLNDHAIQLQHMLINLIVQLKYNLKLKIHIRNGDELLQLLGNIT